MSPAAFDPVFYVLKSANILPTGNAETWLGRVVSHYHAPHYASVPDDPSSLNQRPLKKLVLNDVQQVIQASKGTAYEAQFQGIVEACAAKTKEATFDVSTAKIRIIQLQNHPDVFEKFLQLCNLNVSINKKIREWAKPFGEPLFMVVGVMIWTDAKFSSAMTSDREKSVKMTAPLNTIGNAVTTAQMGIPLIPAGIGDVAFGTKPTTVQKATTSATLTGDQIFAVEYRVVRRLKHTGFTRFGLESELPRFPGQMTLSGKDHLTQDSAGDKQDEKPEPLTLDADDVPWTESLEDASDAQTVEVEGLAGLEVGLSLAFTTEKS